VNVFPPLIVPVHDSLSRSQKDRGAREHQSKRLVSLRDQGTKKETQKERLSITQEEEGSIISESICRYNPQTPFFKIVVRGKNCCYHPTGNTAPTQFSHSLPWRQ
jgi:hypothetical protein